jgi:hypothetical protein
VVLAVPMKVEEVHTQLWVFTVEIEFALAKVEAFQLTCFPSLVSPLCMIRGYIYAGIGNGLR